MDTFPNLSNKDTNVENSYQNVIYKNVHILLDNFNCKIRIFKDRSSKTVLKQIDLLPAVFRFLPNMGDGLSGFDLFDVSLGYRFFCSNEIEAEKWFRILQCMRNSANMNSGHEINATQSSIMSVVIYEKKYELTELNYSSSEHNCDREIAQQKQLFHLSNELFYLQEIIVKYRQRELRSISDKVKSFIRVDEPVFSCSLEEDELIEIVNNEIAIPLQIDENLSLKSNEDSSQIVKWENLIVDNYKPSEKFKEMIRGGIPQPMRQTVWNYCVNKKVRSIKESKISNYYQICLEKCRQTSILASKQIELDLLRTFPEMPCYSNIDSEKIQQLRNVLQAFAIHRQDIGYCQGMNSLVAVALLTLTEEEAFWCLIAIIQILPPDYFSYNLIGAQADQMVFFELFREKCPELSKHLKHNNVDITIFTFSWFLTLFICCGYDNVYYRVWDCFLNEGCKVLFRFAIGLFKLNQETILAIDDSIQIHRFIQSFAELEIDVDLLSHIAFHDIKNLSKGTINEKRHKLTQKLHQELLQRISIDGDDDDKEEEECDDVEEEDDDDDSTDEK